MSASIKELQMGGFVLERGPNHLGWGKQPAATITADDVFPYTAFTNVPTINTVEDNQISGNIFSTGDRITGKMFDGSFDTLDKYSGINNFFFWMFQWEEKVLPVFMVKGTNNGDIGDDYAQGANAYELVAKAPSRTITGKEELISIFRIVTGVLPTATGTLDNTTSTLDDAVYTSRSGQMYRHRFTLDSRGRNARPFTATEITALGAQYSSGDTKLPFATFAKRINDDYGFVYANSLCTGFSMECSGADQFAWKTMITSPYQNRAADPIPDDSVIDCEVSSLANVPAHYQAFTRFAVKDSPLVEYGVTDMSVKVDTPVQKLQTTTSGLGMAEPYLEGKAKISASFTIGRHEIQDFQTYRDGNTDMHGDITMVKGWKVQQMYLKAFTLKTAGPDDGAVAAEPLECFVHWDCQSLMGDTQNSPIIFDTYDEEPKNSMTNRA